MQLKRSGRVTRIGLLHIVTIGLAWLLIIHSANVRLMQWYGGIYDRQVDRSRDEVFSTNSRPIDPITSANAKNALRWYARGSSIGGGGIAFANTPTIEIRRAWLELVLGNLEQAESRLDQVANSPFGTDAHHADLARITLMRQNPDMATKRLVEVLNHHPEYVVCRDLLVWLHLQNDEIELALSVYESRLHDEPLDASCRVAYGSLLLRLGSLERARNELNLALEHNPKDVRGHHELALCYESEGNVKEAIAALERGILAVPLAEKSFRAHLEQISE